MTRSEARSIYEELKEISYEHTMTLRKILDLIERMNRISEDKTEEFDIKDYSRRKDASVH